MGDHASVLQLGGLRADNPLGFLAALGLLEVVHRSNPGARLSWTNGLVPRPEMAGVEPQELVEAVTQDAKNCLDSVVLKWPPEAPYPDLKVSPTDLHDWAVAAADAQDWVSNLWSGLIAEGALDNNGSSKPTHLHFTAGQQRFLVMVRELASNLNEDRINEAVFGPWRYDSTLPSLGLDVRGDRIYALRGKDPAKESRTGVPSADWLAFRGLALYPTRRTQMGRLETTACDGAWKRSAFRWPVWNVPLVRDVVASLVADAALVGTRRDITTGRRASRRPRVFDTPSWVLRERGVMKVYEAVIQRSEQGGYGSFSPPNVLVELR